MPKVFGFLGLAVLAVVIITIAVLMVASFGGLPALATQPTEEPPPQYLTFLPLIARPHPQTATSTPTPTPSPTPTPIPVNVSGTYYTVSSNVVENCDGDYAAPAPTNVPVVQDGDQLTMTFPSGITTGTINTATGAFQVTQSIAPTRPLCPYGCNRTTSGTFNLTDTPLTFDAHTVFEVLSQQGTVYCAYAVDQRGTRN